MSSPVRPSVVCNVHPKIKHRKVTMENREKNSFDSVFRDDILFIVNISESISALALTVLCFLVQMIKLLFTIRFLVKTVPVMFSSLALVTSYRQVLLSSLQLIIS